jgi:hypothetical protein
MEPTRNALYLTRNNAASPNDRGTETERLDNRDRLSTITQLGDIHTDGIFSCRPYGVTIILHIKRVKSKTKNARSGHQVYDNKLTIEHRAAPPQPTIRLASVW